MTDLNHKISRQTAQSLNRVDRNLHSWTFYQLQNFIEYKAKLAGIKVEYVDPKHTSQCCSKCVQVKKSNHKGNLYSCNCKNHIHADLNASRNIVHLGKRIFSVSVGEKLNKKEGHKLQDL